MAVGKRQGGHLGDLARMVTLLIPTDLSPASFQVRQEHQAAFIPGCLFLSSPFQNVCKVGFFGGTLAVVIPCAAHLGFY